MYKVKVTIRTSSMDEKVLLFEFSNLDEFKQGFLKRYGNIRATNKLELQRGKVKKIVKENTCIQSLTEEIRQQTDWIVTIENSPFRRTPSYLNMKGAL